MRKLSKNDYAAIALSAASLTLLSNASLAEDTVIIYGSTPGSWPGGLYIVSDGGLPVPNLTMGSTPSGAYTPTAAEKRALHCAAQYSGAVTGGKSSGASDGHTDTITTNAYASYGWVRSDGNAQNGWITTHLYQAPAAPWAAYNVPVRGVTVYYGANGTQAMSTIFEGGVQRQATIKGTSFQTELMGAYIHEWYHQVYPFAPESSALAAESTAVANYQRDGGDAQASCSEQWQIVRG